MVRKGSYIKQVLLATVLMTRRSLYANFYILCNINFYTIIDTVGYSMVWVALKAAVPANMKVGRILSYFEKAE